MSTFTSFYPNGQAAQTLDSVANTFTSWDASGAQTAQRALTAVEQAQLSSLATGATGGANQATIQSNVQTHIGQIESWITANPNGAVLTAAQTKFLAQCLVGVGRLVLNLTSTVGGAT